MHINSVSAVILALGASSASAQFFAAGPFTSAVNGKDLVELSEVTGQGTTVGTMPVAGAIVGMTTDAGTLYAATEKDLYEVDPTTGALTFAISLGTAAPVLEGCVAAFEGQLYTLSGQEFHRVDLATGQVDLISDVVLNNDWSGMTFLPDGRLLALGFSFQFSRLYEIDPSTGIATDIGPTNSPPNTGSNPSVSGLAFNPGLQALYAVYLGDLYRLNFFSGQSIRLGNTGVASLSGLAYLAPPPPCPADLAEPFGVLDLADVNAFVSAFRDGEPPADLDGNGVYDLRDIGAFVDAFLSGCP